MHLDNRLLPDDTRVIPQSLIKHTVPLTHLSSGVPKRKTAWVAIIMHNSILYKK